MTATPDRAQPLTGLEVRVNREAVQRPVGR